MRLGSLFTGYGGLEMAAGPHFGAENAWCSDIDPGACKIIAHRFRDVPNLGDIIRIDWTQVEPIDILTGGWPCQPFSHAGRRRGAADERALWPEVARAVRALRPRYVFLENVAAIASAGELARAVGDLAALGYVGSWRSLRAADVGAPHGRLRTFILAHKLGQGRRPQPADSGDTSADADEPRPQGPEPARRRDVPHRSAAADTERLDRAGRGGVRDVGEAPEDRGREAQQRQRDRDAAHDRGATAADALCLGDGRREGPRAQAVQRLADGTERRRTAPVVESAWGAYGPAVRRWARILGRLVPAPTEPGPKGGQRLSPRFVEFMMGLSEGWVTDVPGLSRNAQLKALGNGVVPQQAAAALCMLTDVEAAA